MTSLEKVEQRCWKGEVVSARAGGGMDIFVDDLGGLVVVVEITSTAWDTIVPGNRRRLAARHRRQVWKYLTSSSMKRDSTSFPATSTRQLQAERRSTR